MRRVLLAASLLPMLAGCTYWAKPGGTPEELAAAKDNCETAAFGWFPMKPQPVLVSPGYVVPLASSCVPGPDGPHCVTTGGGFVAPLYSTTDLNQGARHNAYQSCLMERGWRPAKDKQEAETITRQSRVATPPSEAAMRGARAYCETIYRRERSADTFDQCVATRAHQLDGS